MKKWGIYGILEYSEPFHNFVSAHIQNPVMFTKIDKPCVILEIQKLWQSGISRTLYYLKHHKYVEPSQRFKMECSVKIVTNYNYFPKALCLRSRL